MVRRFYNFQESERNQLQEGFNGIAKFLLRIIVTNKLNVRQQYISLHTWIPGPWRIL